MMLKRYRIKKKADTVLLALLLTAAALGLIFTVNGKKRTSLPYCKTQFLAAERMNKTLGYLKELVLRNKIAIEEEDVNQTGLIGPEWTALTTSLGNPEAKRTALQPDWAALMVRFYKELGLEKGDEIAIGSSGSFPGLCIASLCAAQEMGLHARIIPSIGASMHGATREEFDIVTILEVTRKAGYIEYELLGVSLGGDFDKGGGNALFPESREELLKTAKRSGAHIIFADTLSLGIQERLMLFGEDIKCFVNIGGASANIGVGSDSVAFPNGLVRRVKSIPLSSERGLAFEYLIRNVPVIHLLNIRQLAEKYGIPIDPVPLTKAGETDVYFHIVYPKALPVLCLLFCLLMLVLFSLKNRRYRNYEKVKPD